MAENKYIRNEPTVLSTVDYMKNVQIGSVESIEDPHKWEQHRLDSLAEHHSDTSA